MSRARSCVSQVKPSPIALMVTRSGNFSSTVRSPVAHAPLTNWTTPTRMPWPMQRKIMPKAAVDLPLPLPVWTISRPLLDGLAGDDLVARRLLLAHLLGVAGVDVGGLVGHAAGSFSISLQIAPGRIGPRRPQAALQRLGEAGGDLGEGGGVVVGEEGADLGGSPR